LWLTECLNHEVSKTTDLSQVTDKLYHIMLYTSPWSRFELTTSVVIGTDCIDSCKSNNHTITTALIYVTLVSSINKTDLHDITQILLKVALNTIKQTNKYIVVFFYVQWFEMRGECSLCWYWWICSQFKLYFIKQYIYSELIDTKLYISGIKWYTNTIILNLLV
jgi:hypothetical protein